MELASAEVAADAVYALVADEDGELRIRAAAEHGTVRAAAAAADTKADLADLGTFLTSYVSSQGEAPILRRPSATPGGR